MSTNREQIPLYAADGIPLGFRSLENAMRQVAGGFVRPVYGRKGHLKAIFLLQEDGGNPVETHARIGSRYSYLQNLDNGGRCWNLRTVDQRDEDGALVCTRGAFAQVVTDCTVK